MNNTARLVLVVLSTVLVLFSLAIVVFPIFRIPTPDPISKHLDALIVAFVAVLARTGKEGDSN